MRAEATLYQSVHFSFADSIALYTCRREAYRKAQLHVENFPRLCQRNFGTYHQQTSKKLPAMNAPACRIEVRK